MFDHGKKNGKHENTKMYSDVTRKESNKVILFFLKCLDWSRHGIPRGPIKQHSLHDVFTAHLIRLRDVVSERVYNKLSLYDWIVDCMIGLWLSSWALAKISIA